MESFRFNEQKSVSLRHRIADDIRKAILEGNLKPGDRLIEQEMSKQMGVSRGPIREAFRVLELEGLIISQPFKETVVAEFSAEEVVEVLIPIRLTVESYAMRKALPLFTLDDFNYLEECVDSMRINGRDDNILKLVESDLAFHEYIVTKSDNANLISIWKSIFYRIRLHFLIQDHLYEDRTTVWMQHKLLVDTMRTANVELSCSQLVRHISDANLAALGIRIGVRN
jgi:DNA-binding GntR family transcriptional regulator